MKSRIAHVKERLLEITPIIAISGPSGAGKDYLTQKAIDYFETQGITTHRVQMTTEREHRGEVETKICISSVEYDKLQKEGLLIGDHVNKVRYGYNTEELIKVVEESKKDNCMVILELNLLKQNRFPSELERKLGLTITSWIGVETTLDQARVNMEERGESEHTIRARLDTMQELIDSMENNPQITLCNNRLGNSKHSVGDFIRIIEDAILQRKKG